MKSALPTSLKRLREATADSSIQVLVFYRGEWCPFSSTWSRGLSNIRNLSSSLEQLSAKVVLISSQPTSKEREAITNFRFTSERGLGTNVHFINDPDNHVAKMLNSTGKCVVVDNVPVAFSGVEFPNGMVQPAVVVARNLFADLRVLEVSCHDCDGTGHGINGGDDRPLACSTLRSLERAYGSQTGCS